MDIKQSYTHHTFDCIVNQKLLSLSNRRVIQILFEMKKKQIRRLIWIYNKNLVKFLQLFLCIFSAYERRDYWIGGTDAGQDGVFKWEGYSQNFSFSNWGPNNPDRLNSADCVILYQPSDYKWHDTSCTNDNSYICEIEL